MKKLVYLFIIGILLISAAVSSAEEKALSNYSTATLKTSPPVSIEKKVEPAAPGNIFKIGYVDVMKIAETSDVGKVAKTHFESKADRYKSPIETKQKLLEKQKATLEAKLPTYTPEQRAAKIKDYEKKVDELRKMLQKADKEMKPMQEELIREVYGKIEKASKDFGGANGFSVILEKRELLYLGSGVEAQDVTEQIIAELNKK
jgi:outer membrane protein